MKRLILSLLALAWVGAAQAPAPTMLFTPTMVSINIGTGMYCAMKPFSDDFYHVYCYTSLVNTWDKLIENDLKSVIDVSVITSVDATRIYYSFTALAIAPVFTTYQITMTVFRNQNGMHWEASGGNGPYIHGDMDAAGNFVQVTP